MDYLSMNVLSLAEEKRKLRMSDALADHQLGVRELSIKLDNDRRRIDMQFVRDISESKEMLLAWFRERVERDGL